MGSGNKSTLVLQKHLKTRTIICCFSLWATAEVEVRLRGSGWGLWNTPETPLPPFSLDVFIQHLAKKEHRDQKISTALLGTINFCNGSPSLHPNLNGAAVPWGEDTVPNKKCEFAAASSTAKGSLTEETLPSQLLPAWRSRPAQHLQDTHKWLQDADGLSKEVIPHHWNTHQRSLCH